MRVWVSGLGLVLASCVSLSAQNQPPSGSAAQPKSAWPRLVADVRAAISGIPTDISFYPPVPAETLVPGRGFGVDVGGHTYAGRLGPARLGFGGSVAWIRGTHDDSVALTSRLITPQVSLNFGSGEGWSYVGGGVGLGAFSGRFRDVAATLTRDSGWQPTFNVGGGARWFITRHVAFTFDLRFHHVGGGTGDDGVNTPAASMGLVSAGLSFK